MNGSMLGLSEFKILEEIQETEKDIFIKVETFSPPTCCPHCHRPAKLYKHGSRNQVILDLPIRSKRVSLQINRKRYKCRSCGAAFWERLKSIDESRNMTKRLLVSIVEQSLTKAFVTVAENVGVDEKTVRNIFKNSSK